MTDGTGNQAYGYDDDDDLRIKNVQYTSAPKQTLTYAFYPDGSRQHMQTPQGGFTYAYDGVGRMSSLTNGAGETSSWTYQPNGWLATQTLGNGVTATYTQDAQGRLTDLANKLGTVTLSEFSVPATGGYDGVSNALSVNATVPGAPVGYSGMTSYQYDYGQTANPQLNRSQLTNEASARLTGNQTYAYDGGGNGTGNPTTFKGITNTFNLDNQTTTSGYTYDRSGNPTTYQANSLTFDPENRLTGYNSTTQTDAYDGDGLRAWKQTGSGKTYFLYDGDQAVTAFNAGTSTTTTFGPNGLLSAHPRFGSSVFYTFDLQGNVSERLDGSGNVLSTDAYDAFGTRTSTVSPQPDPWGYGAQAGYYTDVETGLILCTHRFYDPSTGRWLTRDPIGYEGGINLYGYTGNNPVNESDPSGFAIFPPTFMPMPKTPVWQQWVWGVILGLAGGVGIDKPIPIKIPPKAEKPGKIVDANQNEKKNKGGGNDDPPEEIIECPQGLNWQKGNLIPNWYEQSLPQAIWNQLQYGLDNYHPSAPTFGGFPGIPIWAR